MEADQVFLRGDQRRFVLRFLGLGLIERGLIEARIDLGQHVALLDALSFLEEHLLQLAVDLGVDGDRKESLHSAKAGEIDRYVLPRGGGDADRDGGRAGARGMGRVRTLRPVPIEQAKTGKAAPHSGDQDETTAPPARIARARLHGHSPLKRVAAVLRARLALLYFYSIAARIPFWKMKRKSSSRCKVNLPQTSYILT